VFYAQIRVGQMDPATQKKKPNVSIIRRLCIKNETFIDCLHVPINEITFQKGTMIMLECDRHKDKLSPDIYSYSSSREYYYKDFSTGQFLQPNLVDHKTNETADAFKDEFQKKKK
jgi:hypothetical protein